MRNQSQLAKLLDVGVCKPGESFVFDFGLTTKSGRFASLIGQRWSAPHVPTRQPVSNIPEPPWPQIFDVVAEGAFVGDEWVHDEALVGCVYAQRPDQIAVVIADAIAVGKHLARFVITTHRLLVVAETDAPDFPRDDTHLESQSAQQQHIDNEVSGLRGLWGKAQATARDVQTKLRHSAQAPLIVLGETEREKVKQVTPVELGRMVDHVRCNRFVFADGSMIDVKPQGDGNLFASLSREWRAL